MVMLYEYVAMYLQARFTAYDSANPRQVAQAELSIRVLRNQNGPVYNPSTYRMTIAETYEVGSVVLTLTATDADQVCWLIHFYAHFYTPVKILDLQLLSLILCLKI